MNRNLVWILCVAAALSAGIFIERWWLQSGAGIAAGEERRVLYWVAPMDPGYRRDEPGKSPMGMDLIPVYAGETETDPGLVRIDPAVVNNLGVRTSAAERGPLPRRVETLGYVGYDEDTLHHVHTRVEGWIERLPVKSTGERVVEGQTLMELYSPTLVNAQEEYLAALQSGNRSLRDASLDRLRALGVTEPEVERLERSREVRQRIRIDSRANGVVAHLGVREGMFVTPETEVMSVAELDSVWVLAEVLERQAGWVEPGQTADVVLDSAPDAHRQASVDYVYPELDPVTRTVKVRFRLDNADEALLPNMFARVTIQGTATGPVVHVPREAVIRGGRSDRVVLALGEGRFRSQPVALGIESGGRTEIRRGLQAGDAVVVSGQFLIDSESNIDSALARMEEEMRADPRNPPAGGETGR